MSRPIASEPAFGETLAAHGLSLTRGRADTLQVNTGYLCNLTCRHCHLEAGPTRSEVMDRRTMEQVVACAGRVGFQTVDVTGGAPEMVPQVDSLLDGLAGLAPRRLFRSNLLALRDNPGLVDVLTRGGWSVVASLPAVNEAQVRAVRGPGVFEACLAMLETLNAAGFGRGGPLELHLAASPAGAFLPPAQAAAESRYRRELTERRGIVFDSLLVFANVPLGRFRRWLDGSGNLQGYQAVLRERFNPAVVAGLMCRTSVSVAWDGRVYDCDFNQAAGLPAAWARHVSELDGDTEGCGVATGQHCYACCAGAGFTCGGAVAA